MRALTLSLAVILAACSSATGPSQPLGHDPTAVVRYGSADPVLWWWFDGQATSGVDTIPAGVTKCERFTAQPDSARYDLADSVRIRASGQGWYTYTSNWFDPTLRPTWTITINGYSISVADTTAVPC